MKLLVNWIQRVILEL